MDGGAKNNKLKWVIITIIIIIVIGTILHFTYEWSNENKFVGYFSATNESVWEHLKLIIFPVILACLLQYYFVMRRSTSKNSGGIRNRNLWTGMMLGIVVGMLMIITIFYTYTGAITEKSVIAVDLLTFVFTAIVVAIIINSVFRSNRTCSKDFEMISGLIVIGIVGFVFYATYNPPTLPIFTESLEV